MWILFIDQDIYNTWFKVSNIFYLLPAPVMAVVVSYFLYKAVVENGELSPFLLTILLFCLGFFGFGVSLWPWAVPRKITIWEAAASPESMSFMLIGVALILPVVLVYTGCSYYIFRGKAQENDVHY